MHARGSRQGLVRPRAHGRRAAVTITDAPVSLSQDVASRMRRYWALMGLRLACFAAMFVVPRSWWWLCMVGVVVLPLIAVVVANAGREVAGEPPRAGSGKDLTLGTDDGWEGPRRGVTYRPGEYLR